MAGRDSFYHDMRARFPNAVFLGVTNYPSDTSRQQDLFGPFLYRYSHREAFIDGLARHVDYCFAGASWRRGRPFFPSRTVRTGCMTGRRRP